METLNLEASDVLCGIRMRTETRVSRGYRVVVPAFIRKRHCIDPGDVLVWKEKGDEIHVIHRKRLTLEDITGFVAFPGDAVQLKGRVQTGGK